MKRKTKNHKSKTNRSVPNQVTNLKDLQHDELSGSSNEDSTLNKSNDDEDENEGSGDGTIGRSSRNLLDQ